MSLINAVYLLVTLVSEHRKLVGHCNTSNTTLLATALETQEFERCKSEFLQELNNELRLTVVDLMLRTITGTDRSGGA